MAPRPGIVAEPCPKKRRLLRRCARGPDLKARRSAATLVAFVCDDELIQPLLPQVIVLSESIATAAEAAEVAQRCGGNVLAVRRKSAWVDAALATQLVKVLAACLKTQLRTRHVVLYMDTYSAHTHQSALQACSDAGIHPVFVPASTTGWLQPLDVAVFAKFKSWVAKEMERQKLASESGVLARPQVLEAYRRGIDAVIRRQSWQRAFDLCGLRGPAGVSTTLLSRLEEAELPNVGSDLPTLADLQAVFPNRTIIPVEELFRAALVSTTVPATAVLRLPPWARLPRCPPHQL